MRGTNGQLVQLALVLVIVAVLCAIGAGAAHELIDRASDLLNSIELPQPG